ncbi:MAG: flavodoxin family protein [Candidatus Hermodarchaeota archaeon]
MKILAIIGSPRKGNTYKITQQFEENIQKYGKVDFNYIFLKDSDLKQCIGCFNCFRIGEEHCPLKDDRDDILKQMLDSNGVIFSSPVYMFNVTSLMKNFIDRLSFNGHRPQFFKQDAMIISTTGGVGLKQVKEYLTNTADAWGFRSNTSLGVQTPPYKVKDKFIKKRDKEVEKAAKEFYKKLSKKKWSPSFLNLIQFRCIRGVTEAEGIDKVMTADCNFYEPLKEEKFYFDVKVNPIKYKIAGLLENLTKKSVEKIIKKD